MKARRFGLLLILLGAVGACQFRDLKSTVADAPRAGLRSADIARYLPRIKDLGGPFVRHPRVVTITFASDEPVTIARLATFGDTITRSSWWRAVTEGYCRDGDDCIGDGRPGVAVTLDDALPARIHELDVAKLVTRRAGEGRFGTLDADTLLIVYLPKGVDLYDAFISRYCSGARAIHRSLRLPELAVGYAVLPRCGGEAELTTSASHEILEAATNPNPSNRAFAFEPEPVTLGFVVAGLEPVDPCGIVDRANAPAMESGFAVQRVWSNRAASLGRYPCVPAADGTPNLAFLVHGEPSPRLAKAGDSATVVLEAVADRAVPRWKISPLDLAGHVTGERYLDVALDRDEIGIGDRVTMTITGRKKHPAERSIAAVVSTLGEHTQVWPIAVVMR